MNPYPAEADRAPLCAAADPHARRPGFRMPAASCDTHAHLFGPAHAYPYDPRRIYTPPPAPLDQYRRMLDTLGATRAVLVQPSVYGTDNRLLLDTLRAAGPDMRGVAVIDPDDTGADLAGMHALGVRGLRVNIVDRKDGKGELPLPALRRLAERIAPLGWHLELLMHADEFPDIEALLADLPTPLVFGHMGYPHPGSGPDTPGMAGLIRLMRRGRAWVKLTGPYRISHQPLPYRDIDPLAATIVAQAPDRVLWGTDWPHVMVQGPMPNDGALCDLLQAWVPDAATMEKILVHNPARLYGFDDASQPRTTEP